MLPVHNPQNQNPQDHSHDGDNELPTAPTMPLPLYSQDELADMALRTAIEYLAEAEKQITRAMGYRAELALSLCFEPARIHTMARALFVEMLSDGHQGRTHR